MQNPVLTQKNKNKKQTLFSIFTDIPVLFSARKAWAKVIHSYVVGADPVSQQKHLGGGYLEEAEPYLPKFTPFYIVAVV